MKRQSLICAVVLLMLTYVLDGVVFLHAQKLAGVMLFISTSIVYFSAVLWYVRKPDDRILFSRLWLGIPFLALAGFSIYVFGGFEKITEFEPENLLSLGQLMMSRFQGALWLIGVFMTTLLVIAASLLEKET